MTTVANDAPIYECVGKGGRYSKVGVSFGAGTSKRNSLVIYQDLDTGILYHRTSEDFLARMVRIGGNNDQS